MKRNFNYIILLVLVFFTAFAKAQNDNTPSQVEVPKIVFKADYQRAVTSGEVTVKLLEVLEDSRCPSDVDCIWEGQIKLLIEVSDNGEKTTQEVIIGPAGSSLFYKNNGIKMYLRGVTPYPKTIRKIKPSEYVMLIERRS